MIPGGRNFKEIERKKIGSKSKPKQSKNRALRNFAKWRKLLRNEHFVAKPFRNTIEVSARVFRSCESKFGTRVPLRSTGTFISQLRNALRSCCEIGIFCEIGVLLRNLNWPLGFRFSYLYRSFELRKGFQKSEHHSRGLFVFFTKPRRPSLRSPSPISNAGQSSIAQNGVNTRG